MTINAAISQVEVGGAPTAPRAHLPQLSAAGVGDQSAIARQQLPSAVPAPALIAAYSTHITPPPKQPAKPTVAQPSSALAAQMLAQTPEADDSLLAVFEPRQPPPEPTNDNDAFISPLNLARPQTSPAKAEAVNAKPNLLKEESSLVAQSAANTVARSGTAALASSLPSLWLHMSRGMNLIQARGVMAYQLASLRMSSTRKPPQPSNHTAT